MRCTSLKLPEAIEMIVDLPESQPQPALTQPSVNILPDGRVEVVQPERAAIELKP